MIQEYFPFKKENFRFSFNVSQSHSIWLHEQYLLMFMSVLAYVLKQCLISFFYPSFCQYKAEAEQAGALFSCAVKFWRGRWMNGSLWMKTTWKVPLFDYNVRDILLKLNWCGAEDYVTYTKPWFSGHSNRRRVLPPLN